MTTAIALRLRGATEREIAIELQKLRAVFGYEEGAWKLASKLYLEALADVPADLLSDAVATYIRQAGSGERFPKPGVLRSLIADRLQARTNASRAEAEAAESWPAWLAAIWGADEVEGRRRRDEAGIARDRQFQVAAAYRYKHARGETLPAGLPDDDPMVLAAIRDMETGEQVAKRPQSAAEALGVTATERDR